MARVSCADVLTDGADPAGPEENATTSDHDGAAAGELHDEERMLRVIDLEYVREAEGEHLAPAEMCHGATAGSMSGVPLPAPALPVTPSVLVRSACGAGPRSKGGEQHHDQHADGLKPPHGDVERRGTAR